MTQSLSKFHLGFLVEFDNLILKFIWKCKGPKIVKTILKRVKTIGRLTFLDFKIYDKAKITMTECYWHKERHKDQWSRTESVQINPNIYNPLLWTSIPRQRMNFQYMRKRTLFNYMFLGQLTSTCKMMKLDLCLRPHTKVIQCMKKPKRQS